MGEFEAIDAYDAETELWNVVIETPKGSRNKYKFDEKRKIFALNGVMPVGQSFPFAFGCLIPGRLIGVIEAEQTERDGRTERNDRLVAVADNSHTHKDVKTLGDLNATLLDEIDHFFVSYNEIRGKQFKSLGRFGPDRADKLVKAGKT